MGLPWSPPSNTEIIAKIQSHPTHLSYPRISPVHLSKHGLSHPYICSVFHCFVEELQTGKRTMLLIERMATDLVKEIEYRRFHRDYWSEWSLLSTLESLLSALNYAESRRISHGNIRPDNIYVSFDRNTIKLGVFAKSVSDTGTQPPPTLLKPPLSFLSPETSAKYTAGLSAVQLDEHKADVYSLGVTFLCMMHLVSAGFEVTPAELQYMRTEECYHGLLPLIRRMTETDPALRQRPLNYCQSYGRASKPRKNHAATLSQSASPRCLPYTLQLC